MASGSNVYNHRPMQLNVTRSNPALNNSPPRPSFSLMDSLDAIKREYDSMHSEVVDMRHQRNELESKLDSQVAELNNIRRALFDLETQQSRVRQEYEDEINRLRGELHSARQGGIGSLGIPGRSPRVGPVSSQISPVLLDSQLHPLGRDRLGNGRDKEPMGREGSRPKDEVSRDREFDRLIDHRDPKRHKSRNHFPDGMYSPVGSQHTAKPSSSLHRTPSTTPGPSYSSPTLNEESKLSQEAQELIVALSNAPPECRKEHGEWYAVYNPRVKKALDINLVHTFPHTTVVCCVQFSADGRSLATGCNRTTQIYDVQTGAKVCVLEDEKVPKDGDLYIRSVRFSPDGKLLATGAEDHKIRVWDIAKHRIRYTFDGHQSEIYSLDFSRDGRYIVSGSGDQTMRIWDMSDQSCRVITIRDRDSLDRDAGVTSVAISPDGTMVAAGSLDTVVRIWDLVTGTLLERLRGHNDSVYSVAFTPDGKGIVSGSLDKSLKFWDITNLVNTFSRKGSTAYKDQDPMANDTSSSAALLSFLGHKDFVLSASVSTDSRWVVSGSKDRTVHFWDARTSDLQFMLQGHKNSVISLDINPLGGMFATGSGDHTTRIWTYSAI